MNEARPHMHAQSTKAIGSDLIRYGIAAAVSLAIILASSAFLSEIVNLSSRLAVAVSFLVALVLNFTILRRLVFPGQRLSRRRQLLETAATSFAFRALEYLIFLLLLGAFGIGYLGATVIAVSISFLGKFFVYREIVFSTARR